MGVMEGNMPVSPGEWEEAKRRPGGVEKWIDDNMRNRSCVVVLVGSETARRPWVQHEIIKAWKDGKGLVGVYIHNLRDPRTSKIPPLFGMCNKGPNPFDQLSFNDGNKLSSLVRCYDPNSTDAYNDIKNNIENWVEEAILIRS
jgi:hypothetical protein